MTLIDHLNASGVARLGIDYQWTVRTADKFMAARSEDKPKLADAFRAINDRALFGLIIANTEWVVARVAQQADPMKVGDALRRIEAAWVALVDPRYAQLPEPDDAEEADGNMAADGPIWAATTMMGDAFAEGLEPGDPESIFNVALGLSMLAEHVCGRSPAFKSWLPELLKRLQQTHPAERVPMSAQKPASIADFRPAGAPSIFDGLLPEQNPYLRPAAELLKAGMAAPYRHQP
ncbi:hypothetical protein [Roseateles amylovorans]|uniref:Uncharacterized protein n=1 Tax=Roseateles amylovorans TaxID=2978473 RepID=A0ABY6B5X0_9BURK|nr:hypothetical protein [Roseateles amylovorans]UXH80654.1 hypothetical protein N4261_12575 [Roseateles amylovorans]